MISIALTCYGVLLFLALCSLLRWSHRRNRLARKFRQTVAAALVEDNPALVGEEQSARPHLVP